MHANTHVLELFVYLTADWSICINSLLINNNCRRRRITSTLPPKPPVLFCNFGSLFFPPLKPKQTKADWRVCDCHTPKMFMQMRKSLGIQHCFCQIYILLRVQQLIGRITSRTGSSTTVRLKFLVLTGWQLLVPLCVLGQLGRILVHNYQRWVIIHNLCFNMLFIADGCILYSTKIQRKEIHNDLNWLW